jgi:hypothetical protein
MMLVSFLQNQPFFLELVVSLVLSAFFNKKNPFKSSSNGFCLRNVRIKIFRVVKRRN